MSDSVFLFPPNYRAINKKFNVRGKPIIFAYGDKIFNPSRIQIPPHLIEHEKVHQTRQGGNPAAWWERYIESEEFRLNEEIPAHIAEALALIEGGWPEPQAIMRTASKLSSPLYGQLIDMSEAIARIESVTRHRHDSTATGQLGWVSNDGAGTTR